MADYNKHNQIKFMGFFSWTTSEGQSIANVESGRPTFTVWMVLPGGTKYQEDCYDGYGVFGGKDFYEAVAELNGHSVTSDEDERRSAGIDLYFGAVERDRVGVIMPRFTRDTGASPRQLADRVEALEQALSIALQHVPLEGDDARNIYELEKSTYIKNEIPNHTQREGCAGPRSHG